MKDFILLIAAILLFLFLGFVGFVYSATYYLFHEKNKQGSYCFRIAFGIDCFANIVGGEFIEALVSTERGLTSFGTNVSISACIGETIAENRFKAKYQWFSKLLDFVFNEKDHCINAYRKEILKLNINNMKKVTNGLLLFFFPKINSPKGRIDLRDTIQGVLRGALTSAIAPNHQWVEDTASLYTGVEVKPVNDILLRNTALNFAKEYTFETKRQVLAEAFKKDGEKYKAYNPEGKASAKFCTKKWFIIRQVRRKSTR